MSGQEELNFIPTSFGSVGTLMWVLGYRDLTRVQGDAQTMEWKLFSPSFTALSHWPVSSPIATLAYVPWFHTDFSVIQVLSAEEGMWE